MSMKTWSWQQAVQESELSSTTRHVLLNLSVYMNNRGENCYPSTATQAKDTGLSERTIITHLQIAKDAGYIKVKRHGFGDQHWKLHEYLPVHPSEIPKPKKGTEPDDKEALNLTPKGAEPDEDKALNVAQKGAEPDAAYMYEPPNESPKVTSHVKDARALMLPAVRQGHREYTSDFEAFWSRYPKNGASKGEAFKAFLRAIKEGGNSDEIIRGAGAYADHCGRTGTLIAHATTWLNNQRWTVEYSQLGGGGPWVANPSANDRRDPAARARDEGERIIAERAAARANAEKQPGSPGPANPLALPDLRLPENLRGESGADTGPGGDVSAGPG